MEFAILFRQEINEYHFGANHPFSGKRGEIFLRFFKENFKKEFPVLKAKKANEKDLTLICDKDYIEFTKNYFKLKNLGLDFDGNFYQYHSADNLPLEKPGKLEEAARFIVGQAKLAADLVCQDRFKKVISVGGGLHHAKRNFGEGFCLYNDVAFCAEYLLEKYKIKKILILDTDAHAGNGTMEYFYSNPQVLFIDLHQDPKTIYPGSGFIKQIGEGEGKGFTINIPLPPLAGNLSYRMVFEEIVEPIVKEFSPQIIIRNGGSDPHFSDPLTNLNLDLEGFRMIGEKTRMLAEICQGREIDFIVSGYNLKILPFAWMALFSGLLEFEIKNIPPEKKFFEEPIFETKEIIKKTKKTLKSFWSCF